MSLLPNTSSATPGGGSGGLPPDLEKRHKALSLHHHRHPHGQEHHHGHDVKHQQHHASHAHRMDLKSVAAKAEHFVSQVAEGKFDWGKAFKTALVGCHLARNDGGGVKGLKDPKKSGHHCAHNVIDMLNAGGFKLPYKDAKDMGHELTKAGFVGTPVPKNYKPMYGDVIQIGKTAEHPFGHLETYTCNGWVSDFEQKGHTVYEGGKQTLYRNPALAAEASQSQACNIGPQAQQESRAEVQRFADAHGLKHGGHHHKETMLASGKPHHAHAHLTA